MKLKLTKVYCIEAQQKSVERFMDSVGNFTYGLMQNYALL
jgi:hypothetical protein